MIATERQHAADELAVILDSKLFKALCEPGRVDILKFLVVHGRADIAAIAEQVPQDRSVVSRHLHLLEEVGILRGEKIGRHRFYEVDGWRFMERIQEILDRVERIMPLCCPRKPA